MKAKNNLKSSLYHRDFINKLGISGILCNYCSTIATSQTIPYKLMVHNLSIKRQCQIRLSNSKCLLRKLKFHKKK
jgi:hypothetical protein